MENIGQVLEHLKGPIPLVGLALMLLAGLVQQLGGHGGDRQTRRTLVLGMLGLGAIVCVGGLLLAWQESGSSKNQTPAPSTPGQESSEQKAAAASQGSTTNTTGIGNVVGNGNIVSNGNAVVHGDVSGDGVTVGSGNTVHIERTDSKRNEDDEGAE